MNFSVILGFVVAVSMITFVVREGSGDMSMFVNLEGMAIVFGGTIAAGFLIFPVSNFLKMGKAFWNKVVFNRKTVPEEVIKQILSVAKGMRQNPEFLKTASKTIKEPFFRDAIEMMARGGIQFSEIESILKMRLAVQYEIYEEEAEVFKTLSKFPPAFGLMGTTFGMINLMRHLGEEDSFSKIGPSMGIALIATLYGIGLANLVLIPFGERLVRLNKEDNLIKSMVIEGIKLLDKKAHPLIIEEHLISFLLPGARGKYSRDNFKDVA